MSILRNGHVALSTGQGPHYWPVDIDPFSAFHLVIAESSRAFGLHWMLPISCDGTSGKLRLLQTTEYAWHSSMRKDTIIKLVYA